ncbi:Uncharacterised protein [uncultured archaeon]|nr:Uncharacterised protein [uncultured archaeon]
MKQLFETNLILGVICIFAVCLLAATLGCVGSSGPVDFVKEANISLDKEIDSSVSISLASTIPPENSSKTVFETGEAIYPMEEGLKIGDKFAFRVADENGAVIIPLDEYPYSTIKQEGGAGSGTINTDKVNLLYEGNYTLQLVKIDSNNTKATIVSEKNFSVTRRYSKEILANLRFWLTKEERPDAEEFLELDLTGIDQINFAVWGEAPKDGREINGRAIMVREDYDGNVLTESGPWDYPFTLLPGVAQKLNGMSGHPYPGTYHVKIIIDNELIKEYRVKV